MRDFLKTLLVLVVLAAPAAGAEDVLPRAPAQGVGGALLENSAASSGRSFLPVERAYPLEASLEGNEAVFQWQIAEGYYLYRERLRFSAVGSEGPAPLAVVLPEGEAHEDEFLGQTQIYRGYLEVRVPLGASAALSLEVKSQGCADAGLCYPPRTQVFAVDPSAGTIVEAAAGAPPARAAPARRATPDGTLSRALYMALLAAAGGLILNLMPCVFPVLSLKVLSIASKSDATRASKALHGTVYTAGVVLSFIAVAAVLIALRGAGAAIGWGFHLQSPGFVAGLTYLFFAMGLALSGLINLGAGLMGAGGRLATHGGYAGSFFTGVLATVVASPCTAPFMGTALGYAMTQPALVALSVFAALGLGMAAPFLVLSLSPGLIRLLPKPGAWMDAFKQFLAFPLYAAAVWLLWVLGKQSGVNAMAAISGGCVLVALAMWMWERGRLSSRALPMRLAGAAVLVLALTVLRSPLLEAQRPSVGASAEWERYSPSLLSELRAAGKPVFVNVTADWCITCLANEKVALGNEAVRADFERRGITYLKGDWTNSDPVLTRLLAEHGRSGVPLYLLYAGSHQDPPLILPQLLTPSIVLDTLAEAFDGA